jgi:outer membrane protein
MRKPLAPTLEGWRRSHYPNCFRGMPFVRNPIRAGVVLGLLTACAPPSRVGGAPSTAPAPSAEWTAQKRTGAGEAFDGTERERATRGAVVPRDVASRLDRLTVGDVVDLALGNNPQTRTTWAQARAAAAAYASARGHYLPSLELDGSGGPSKTISFSSALVPPDRSAFTTTLSLTYVLLDFGQRGGGMAAAHEALFAADLTHNATVQDVVLQAESAYFTYQASRGLYDAADTAVRTAQTNLAAADRRHEVGLATIADVLQARTALAQSQLTLQTDGGNIQAARAQLALALGLPANAHFDAAPDTGMAPVQKLAENIDSLIDRVARDRPDVAAARALARQSQAQVRQARSAALPVITLGANEGNVQSSSQTLAGNSYALSFGVAIPIFSGFSHEYDIVTAKENAAAAASRANQTELVAVSQVFTSYYALQTATQRVSTSAELLTSAVQSEEVARGRYAEGVGSILDLLTAQSALADARAQSVLSRWTWYASLAQLSHDAGVLGSRGEPNITLTPAPAGRP